MLGEGTRTDGIKVHSSRVLLGLHYNLVLVVILNLVLVLTRNLNPVLTLNLNLGYPFPGHGELVKSIPLVPVLMWVPHLALNLSINPALDLDMVLDIDLKPNRTKPSWCGS